MDYLRNVVPSQLIAERGADLVVINPGSANVRIGLANQSTPFIVPHCIARHFMGKSSLKDQALNFQATEAQNLEREQSYDIIASLLKIPFLDEETPDGNVPLKNGYLDGPNLQQRRNDAIFNWTKVVEKKSCLPSSVEIAGDDNIHSRSNNVKEPNSEEYCYKSTIYGDDAMKIAPSEPYCFSRPIRRGHFNISNEYSCLQVCEDLCAIWNWILVEKLHIQSKDRSLYSAVLVLSESFDNREIQEMLSIVLRDLGFRTAVVHQESLAAAFGNGLLTACIVNMGSQVTSVVCIEDGVALPSTTLILPYGGEDISRCLLWIQHRHQSWPDVKTEPCVKHIDMLMLNKIKELYCHIREGEFDAVAIVQSHELDKSVRNHRTRLSALNVPPMGLFFPKLFFIEEYPPPPRHWFQDHEDMLEDSQYYPEVMRRPDPSDTYHIGANSAVGMWENYPLVPVKLKKYDSLGLDAAIVSSILSTGRIDLQRKLFCSIQLIGGVASTSGLVAAVEDRVLQAIPTHEAIDSVEVLLSRSEPSSVSWKGGVILGILDFSREAWIHREDWIKNGVHVGSGRKYKDSFFLQAQAMCFYNS